MMDKTKKMNPEIKTEWVKRLRDGREQGRMYLEVEGKGQCCLGVLCEIAEEQGIVTKHNNGDTSIIEYLDRDNYSSVKALPPGVAKWAGVSNFKKMAVNPAIAERVVGMSTVSTLAGANDAGLSFPEIADIIEKEF